MKAAAFIFTNPAYHFLIKQIRLQREKDRERKGKGITLLLFYEKEVEKFHFMMRF
jgi:hypothetical protein